MSASDEALPWVIIGAGRVGRTLALLAARQGVEVSALWSRDATSSASARASLPALDEEVFWYGALDALGATLAQTPALVWLSVVDDAIEPVARALAPYLGATHRAVHLAGALASTALREAGLACPVASLHPLQAIADPALAIDALARCTWTLEGDDAATQPLDAIMARAGVRPVRLVPQNKALYHAAAVTCANLLVALMDAAYSMVHMAGVTQPEVARQMLLPLAQSCLDNLATKSCAEALTGPVARGDEGTITRHIEALRASDDPSLAPLYEALTARARALRREPQG